jgi:hypothetical protein
MSREAIERVRALEAQVLALPQTEIATRHVIHGGMYARTIRVPAGVLLTGAEIKIATVLVIHGHSLVTLGEQTVELVGHNVLPASAGRKQAFLALADTDLTMVFPTSARTVEEAENQFTDEADQLFSRHGENVVIITGE